MSQVDILGTKVNSFSKDKFLSLVEESLNLKKKLFLVTANPEGVLLARENRKFGKAVNNADYVTADGWGLIWASSYLNKKIIGGFLRFILVPMYAIFSLILFSFNKKMFTNVISERIAGSDIFWDILKIANKTDKKVYLLGGFSGVAQKTAKKIKNKFPNLRIVGISESSPHDKKVLVEINQVNPDLLFVAWGQPKQETWIFDNLDRLNIDLAIGVGGTFDFVAGSKKRAPKFFRRSGFEWLWRFFIEPKRFFRTFAAVPKFVYAVCRDKIKRSGKVICEK